MLKWNTEPSQSSWILFNIFSATSLEKEQWFFAIHHISSPRYIPNKKFSPKDIFPPSPRESLKFPSSMEQTEQSGKRRRIWCPFSNLSLNPSAKAAGSFGEAVKGQENSILILTSQWGCYEGNSGNPWGVVDMMFDLCTFSITSISKYVLETSSINLKSARCRWCHPWHLFFGPPSWEMVPLTIS